MPSPRMITKSMNQRLSDKDRDAHQYVHRCLVPRVHVFVVVGRGYIVVVVNIHADILSRDIPYSSPW